MRRIIAPPRSTSLLLCLAGRAGCQRPSRSRMSVIAASKTVGAGPAPVAVHGRSRTGFSTPRVLHGAGIERVERHQDLDPRRDVHTCLPSFSVAPSSWERDDLAVGTEAADKGERDLRYVRA